MDLHILPLNPVSKLHHYGQISLGHETLEPYIQNGMYINTTMDELLRLLQTKTSLYIFFSINPNTVFVDVRPDYTYPTKRYIITDINMTHLQQMYMISNKTIKEAIIKYIRHVKPPHTNETFTWYASIMLGAK